MRFLPLFLLLSLSIFPQTTYFRSNNTGMKLEEIDILDINNEEFYISITNNEDDKIIREEFYDNSSLTWYMDKSYTNSPDLPNQIIKIEGNIREVSNYKDNGLLQDFSRFKNDDLEYKETSLYNNKGFIKSLTRTDINDEVIYTDFFFRGSKGELRSVIRESGDGYSNHWFYSNGAIVESWFIEGNSKTRTNFTEDGDTLSVTNYIDEEVSYFEDYNYDENRVLVSIIKTIGESKEERFYNSNGYVSNLKIKANDILVRSHSYGYSDDTLISEKITGHGKIEEFIYTLDSNGDVILISYYVDRVLKSNTIIESDDKEIKEFFKDGVIYLREYFKDKEKVERELFIDGILFKSEKIDE